MTSLRRGRSGPRRASPLRRDHARFVLPLAVASRPSVKGTASHQGMPPREACALEAMHAPPLVLTATGDSLLAAGPHVTPTRERSNVEAFHATLADAMIGHLYPWTWTPSAWRR